MSSITPGVRPTDLPSGWRSKAKLFREHEETSVALAYEKCASALEEVLIREDDVAHTLTEAAQLSGYSADHLGRLVREGKIPNAGRLGAPRIACGDLPRKPDVAADIETGHISSKQIVRSAINEGAG